MKETGLTIGKWALDTFGDDANAHVLAARANEEMAEFMIEVARRGTPSQQMLEAADVVIVLAHWCSRWGVDLFEFVDKKMLINREREWNLKGDGTGYHVKG